MLYTECTLERLQELLARSLALFTIEIECELEPYEIEILRNLDFDRVRRYQYPDGFLYFQYRIDVFLVEGRSVSLNEQTALVTYILQYLWLHHVPAVAACDFENQLPNSSCYFNIRSMLKPRTNRMTFNSKPLAFVA